MFSRPAGFFFSPSRMARMRVSLRMRRSWNAPVAGRSGGIFAVFSQLPFTYSKKLSPGRIVRSIADRSTPQLPYWAWPDAILAVLAPIEAAAQSATANVARRGFILFELPGHEAATWKVPPIGYRG